MDILAHIPDEYRPFGYRSASENRLSVPAVLKIAAACGALQTLKLDAGYGTPSTEPMMRRSVRDAAAIALAHFPSSLQSVRYIGDSYNESGGESYTRLPSMAFRKQDMLSLALHKISTKLMTLCIDHEAVFPEFFCPNGLQSLLQTHWPYLETLQLTNIDESSAFSGLARYADGTASDETLLDRYMDDLYTKAGYAAQRMPQLRDLVVRFMHSSELCFGYYRGKWSLGIMKRGCDTYVPSSRVVEA
jgi:hypothetical protein